MDVTELIDQLDAAANTADPAEPDNAAGEVRVYAAVQPHWPLAKEILGVRRDSQGRVWVIISDEHPADLPSPYAPGGLWRQERL